MYWSWVRKKRLYDNKMEWYLDIASPIGCVKRVRKIQNSLLKRKKENRWYLSRNWGSHGCIDKEGERNEKEGNLITWAWINIYAKAIIKWSVELILKSSEQIINWKRKLTVT